MTDFQHVHIARRHLLQTGAGYSSDSNRKLDNTLYTPQMVDRVTRR
jgi:hypothetical protein